MVGKVLSRSLAHIRNIRRLFRSVILTTVRTKRAQEGQKTTSLCRYRWPYAMRAFRAAR